MEYKMKPYRIVKIINLLDEKIKKMPDNCFFNEGASVDEVMELEFDLGIILPLSYKIFLNHYNGGFICGKYQAKMIKEDGAFEDARWNSVHLFSLEEIREIYEEKSLMNWKLSNQEFDIYPFIPFCRTAISELLIFANPLDKKMECPVFDASHEEFPSSWGKLFMNFTKFLDKYVNNNGFIPTISYDSPTALEFIETQAANLKA